MRKLFPHSLLFFYLLVSHSLWSETDFLKTENNVDLIEEPIFDKYNELQGKQYFVLNRNSFSVYIQLKLVNDTNVVNDLIQNPQFVGAEQLESFGQVLIENRTLPADWSVDFAVTRQQSQGLVK